MNPGTSQQSKCQVLTTGPPGNSQFAFYMRVCMLSRFGHAGLFATPWTVTRQAPLSMGFSRQEYWSGLPCPPPGGLPDVSYIGRWVLYHRHPQSTYHLSPVPHFSKLPTPVLCLPGHQVIGYQPPSLGGEPRQVDPGGVTAASVPAPGADVPFSQLSQAGQCGAAPGLPEVG